MGLVSDLAGQARAPSTEHRRKMNEKYVVRRTNKVGSYE